MHELPAGRAHELWALPANGGLMLSLQHSGGFEDNNSRTDLALYVNGLAQANRYDFGGYVPPYPPSAANSTGRRK